jgi:hypothetical protein
MWKAMSRRFSLLLTASQTAEVLGVSLHRILSWASDGKLRVIAQTENGQLLFREHEIAGDGEMLAALVPPGERRPRKYRLHAALPFYERPPEQCDLGCGCNLARSPLYLCRTGAALNAALQLAEMLAVAMPNDPLLRKLAGLCREALMKHLMPGVAVITASAAGRNSGDWPVGETRHADGAEIAAAESQHTESASNAGAETDVS